MRRGTAAAARVAGGAGSGVERSIEPHVAGPALAEAPPTVDRRDAPSAGKCSSSAVLICKMRAWTTTGAGSSAQESPYSSSKPAPSTSQSWTPALFASHPSAASAVCAAINSRISLIISSKSSLGSLIASCSRPNMYRIYASIRGSAENSPGREYASSSLSGAALRGSYGRTVYGGRRRLGTTWNQADSSGTSPAVSTGGGWASSRVLACAVCSSGSIAARGAAGGGWFSWGWDAGAVLDELAPPGFGFG